MRLRRSHTSLGEEENPYWMSFSDIMSGLLVIFILASTALMLQLMEMKDELKHKQERFEKEIVELKQAEEVRRTILHEAVETLRERGIRVEISQNSTVMSIPNELLGFNTAAYEISTAYQAQAREIGEVLNGVIAKDNRTHFLDTVFVEGHTDNRPINGFMGKGNWGLSTFRAISLWQFWEQVLPADMKLSRLVNADGLPLFSVSGYAETRPALREQLTEVDFRRNRRIDIRFTIRRPDSSAYEQVRDRLEEAAS